MRAGRICGIKALSNIKQKREQQTMRKSRGGGGEEGGSKAETTTSLGFLLFYLAPSVFCSIFCFHSEAVRQKTAK